MLSNRTSLSESFPCRFDKALLLAFADGTIDQLARIFAEEHVKVCAGCQADLLELSAVDESLRDVFSSIDVPSRLSEISEMVVANAFQDVGLWRDTDIGQPSTANKGARTHTIRRVISGCTEVSQTAVEIGRFTRQNPYHEAIDRGVESLVTLINAPVKRVARQSLRRMNPLRHLISG